MFTQLFALALACLSYTVQPGDNLAHIARANQTDVTTIAQVNGLGNANLITVGQVLCIPHNVPLPTEPIVTGGSLEQQTFIKAQLSQTWARCPELVGELHEVRIEATMPDPYMIGWVDTVGAVAHILPLPARDRLFQQQVFAHEAAHVRLFREGLNSEDETLASIIASTCYPDWTIR